MRAALNRHGYSGPDELPYGDVVAICRLVAVHPTEAVLERCWGTDEVWFGDFSHGRFAWELKVVERVQIPARGYQGLWDWEDPR